MQRSRTAAALAAPLLAVLALGPARAGTTTTVTETFDGTLDDATWRMGSFDQISTFGGNPGAYLRNTTLDAAELQIFAKPNAAAFLGDYRARGVIALGIDINILAVGISAQGRPVSLVLHGDMGTPDDSSDDCDAWFVGSKNVPKPGTGWKPFDFRVRSDQKTLPPGWVLDGVCRGLGEDDAWNAVITRVTGASFAFGEPGFFYYFQIWSLGVDNARITTGAPLATEP
jgi:hypothetical protein